MVGLSVAVVAFGASAWPAAARAGADPIASTQAQIDGLRQQVSSVAARIHSLTLTYEQASTQASTLAQQVGTDQAQVARLRQAAQVSAAELRADAILSYTGGTTTTASNNVGSDDPAIRDEYMQVAAGNLSDSVDQYRTQMAQVAAAESTLAADMRASQEAAQATATARQAALSQAGQVQAQLTQVQGRLQQLEAAQAAAEAAAARAQAMAQAQARTVALAQSQAAQAAAAANASQGAPVNGGLVSVVTNVVAAPPASSSGSSPPSTIATGTTPSGGTTSTQSGGGGTTSGGGTGTTAGGGAGGVWLQLRECESGDNYQENSGNGYYGAYQFSQQTWNNLGYPGRPDQEPPAMQDAAAQKLQAASGWGQWPACAAALGLT